MVDDGAYAPSAAKAKPELSARVACRGGVNSSEPQTRSRKVKCPGGGIGRRRSLLLVLRRRSLS